MGRFKYEEYDKRVELIRQLGRENNEYQLCTDEIPGWLLPATFLFRFTKIIPRPPEPSFVMLQAPGGQSLVLNGVRKIERDGNKLLFTCATVAGPLEKITIPVSIFPKERKRREKS